MNTGRLSPAIEEPSDTAQDAAFTTVEPREVLNAVKDTAAERHSANSKSSHFHQPLLTSRHTIVIYLLFLLAVYWPVFLEQRFFWEDFFNQEYPVREFSFYMVRWAHALPFWNPYSWGWSPFLADAQSGFWYPTNLLGIVLTWLFAPHAAHLPVIVPETMTLLHMPLGAIGMFVLARRQLSLGGLSALAAGLSWGFGVQMAAVQNHSMFVIQLALLPWETLLLIRSWTQWKPVGWLGLLFGTSFFAGQPQAFFYIAIFFGAFTLAESVAAWKRHHTLHAATKPLVHASAAMAVALGISAIQLLPTWELIGRSAREHLSYAEASVGHLQPQDAMNFFVPKFYGENPGFSVPKSAVVRQRTEYWETSFYWGEVGEILAMFALVRWWKSRIKQKQSHIPFFLLFSGLCLAYAMGPYLCFQWLFWRFLPFFSHIRAPNRMVWFLWFTGSLLAGAGIDALSQNWSSRYSKFFLWSGGIFFFLNLLALSGVPDEIHHALNPIVAVRTGLWQLLYPQLLISAACMTFFLLIARRKITPKIAVWSAVLLIVVDLYYNDFTWFRNTLNRETVVAEDSSSTVVQHFRTSHSSDHAKLVILEPDSIRKMRANLGMFLRLPIEYAESEQNLIAVNPLRMDNIFPPVRDPARRLSIMGVARSITNGTHSEQYDKHLPFIKLYREWQCIPPDSSIAVLNDPAFDYTSTLLLEEQPAAFPQRTMHADTNILDTAFLVNYSENDLTIVVHASQPSMLLINDIWYPAWQAMVDRRDAKIYRAFTSLRAVPVSAGIHTVELRYESKAFALGRSITLISIGLTFMGLFVGRRHRKRFSISRQ